MLSIVSVLPVFGPSPQNKRISGATVSPTGLNLTKNYLVNFFIRLREPTCLAVVISLLARLHNVLKDEPNLEINCQYIGVWPAVVSKCVLCFYHFLNLIDLVNNSLNESFSDL